jgi:hypothetical protein
MGSEDLSVDGCQATPRHVIRDLETIDAELQLVAAFRRAARVVAVNLALGTSGSVGGPYLLRDKTACRRNEASR